MDVPALLDQLWLKFAGAIEGAGVDLGDSSGKQRRGNVSPIIDILVQTSFGIGVASK